MNCGIIPSNMKTKLKVRTVALMTGAALGCAMEKYELRRMKEEIQQRKRPTLNANSESFREQAVEHPMAE